MSVKPLPPGANLETVPVLKAAAGAHRYLAELKGVSGTIPNQAILINSLSLQEAQDSSAIENIVTTHDDLYKESLFPESTRDPAAKEVQSYSIALRAGYDLVRKDQCLATRHILAIQEELERNRAGFRELPGTQIINEQSGQTVYVPPQDPQEIISLMTNVEDLINNDAFWDVDPLIKMAVIHHQFESIHPFYDGNGRTGRIINVLYLVLKDLLSIPVLYLSRYIVRNKAAYYGQLQAVRDTGNWEPWVLYMLEAVESTARETIQTVKSINAALMDYKHRIRSLHRFYSQDLINALFVHPYTKIEFVRQALGVTRLTASKYLAELTDAGFLDRHKIGRSNYYVNRALFAILTQ